VELSLGVIDDCHIRGATGGGIVYAYVGTPTLGRLTISKSSMDGSPAWVAAFLCTCDVTLIGNRFYATSGYIYIPGAAGQVIVRGGSNTAASTSIGSITAGAVRLMTMDIPVDLSTAGIVRTLGDMAYNSNNALSCGQGPAVCNGTLWKGLYSGATY
jgi:hypothetical protein